MENNFNDEEKKREIALKKEQLKEEIARIKLEKEIKRQRELQRQIEKIEKKRQLELLIEIEKEKKRAKEEEKKIKRLQSEILRQEIENIKQENEEREAIKLMIKIEKEKKKQQLMEEIEQQKMQKLLEKIAREKRKQEIVEELAIRKEELEQAIVAEFEEQKRLINEKKIREEEKQKALREAHEKLEKRKLREMQLRKVVEYLGEDASLRKKEDEIEEVQREIKRVQRLIADTSEPIKEWPSTWDTLHGKLMEYRFEGDPILTDDKSFNIVVHNEIECDLQIAKSCVGKGTFRMAHFAKLEGVKKIAKYQLSCKNEIQNCESDIKTSLISQLFANAYNSAPKGIGFKSIQYVSVRLFRLEKEWNEARYLIIEDSIDGKFTKFNNNSDYVNHTTKCSTAQTFSHFTYHISNQKMMLTDIQGASIADKTGYLLTDAAIHSVSGEFGGSDCKLVGMEKFLQGHCCNSLCQALRVPISPLQKVKNIRAHGETEVFCPKRFGV